MTDNKDFIENYEKSVAYLNCVHVDEHGKCELLSDDEISEYCPVSPCSNYEEN